MLKQPLGAWGNERNAVCYQTNVLLKASFFCQRPMKFVWIEKCEDPIQLYDTLSKTGEAGSIKCIGVVTSVEIYVVHVVLANYWALSMTVLCNFFYIGAGASYLLQQMNQEHTWADMTVFLNVLQSESFRHLPPMPALMKQAAKTTCVDTNNGCTITNASTNSPLDWEPQPGQHKPRPKTLNCLFWVGRKSGMEIVTQKDATAKRKNKIEWTWVCI
jgi:hypothetical protein